MSDQAETGHSSAMWQEADTRIPYSYLDVTLSPEVKWEAQAKLLLQQLLAERERCAKIAEEYGNRAGDDCVDGCGCGLLIADKIREGV